MAVDTSTAAVLTAMLVELLAGATGTPEAAWTKPVGKIEVLPLGLHPAGNWRVKAAGLAEQRKVIEQAVALLRANIPMR